MRRWRARLDAIRAELRYHRALLADPQTPALARWLLGAALAYLVSPIDLVPDFVPLLGQLDDVIVVALLVGCALRLVPGEVKARARRAASIATSPQRTGTH